ncbi:MAG: agmatine deiminase family protein, partial [Bythopirellula sp.]
RQGRAVSEIVAALENAISKRVVAIDIPRSGSPIEEDLEYHLDMAMTLLPDDTVLLSDPAAGEAYAPATWKRTGDRQLRIDAVANRLFAIEQRLESHGLAVERIPALLLPSDSSVATYVNVLQETDATQRVVYLPQYGFEAIDRAAVERFQQLGYGVHPIRLNNIYRAGGSLRCLVNVVARKTQ